MPFILTLFIAITLLSINMPGYAGPIAKVCIKTDCKQPLNIEVSDATWSIVKDLFSTPFPTDKDEQDNINSSLLLIQKDIYQSLQTNSTDGRQAQDIYAANSVKNNYRNSKSMLGLLLDNYLMTRHFVRKTVSGKHWLDNSSGLLLQSLKDSKIYLLQLNVADLNAAPIILDYKPSNDGFSFFNEPDANIEQIDNDFE